MIKVTIDAEACRGHQMCILGMPNVFVVGDNEEGQARVLVANQPDGRLEDLRRVVASCPQQAIHVARLSDP
jgi:ferredoxin